VPHSVLDPFAGQELLLVEVTLDEHLWQTTDAVAHGSARERVPSTHTGNAGAQRRTQGWTSLAGSSLKELLHGGADGDLLELIGHGF